MRGRWVFRGLKFIVFIALAALVMGYLVLHLWNWLLPGLFGWRAISFWQALGLLFLARILFGGFRPRGPRNMYWRHRMIERWGQMTPEQRDQFRQGMRGRCGNFGRPATPATEAKI